jgi:hypothetical protein
MNIYSQSGAKGITLEILTRIGYDLDRIAVDLTAIFCCITIKTRKDGTSLPLSGVLSC